MGLPATVLAAVFALAVALWTHDAAASDRDFVFADDEGYLILRFAGVGPAGVSTEQMAEVINASVSTMVHDRLLADVSFDAEPEDRAWAGVAEPRIEAELQAVGPGFPDLDIECHARTCRLVLEHTRHLTVEDHEELLGSVQQVISDFIGRHAGHFEPGFLIAAYEQERETPAIKAYLTRAGILSEPEDHGGR